MTADRPSITELQRTKWYQAMFTGPEVYALRLAAPVLLEIAAAAQEWERTLGAPRGDKRADEAFRSLIAALARVRP